MRVIVVLQMEIELVNSSKPWYLFSWLARPYLYALFYELQCRCIAVFSLQHVCLGRLGRLRVGFVDSKPSQYLSVQRNLWQDVAILSIIVSRVHLQIANGGDFVIFPILVHRLLHSDDVKFIAIVYDIETAHWDKSGCMSHYLFKTLQSLQVISTPSNHRHPFKLSTPLQIISTSSNHQHRCRRNA